jgi:hypothetical protein
MLGLRRVVGTEVVYWLGANKPAHKLDPGFLEHPRLSPGAVIGPGARFGPISGFGFGPPTITTTVPTFSAVTSRKFGDSTRGGRVFALVPRRRWINQRFTLSLCPNHF